jgi:hypothetical protein
MTKTFPAPMSTTTTQPALAPPRRPHALPQMTLPRRYRPELGRGRRFLGASSHGHGVLRPILPAEPAALLKLTGVGGPMRSSVSIRPNLPCFWMMRVIRAALASVSKQPQNPPFWIAPLSGSTRRPGILPAEAPSYTRSASGLKRCIPPSPIPRLPFGTPHFLETCLLKRACGD